MMARIGRSHVSSNGASNNKLAVATKPPNPINNTASRPRPCSKNLVAGNTATTLLSSGANKNTAGRWLRVVQPTVIPINKNVSASSDMPNCPDEKSKSARPATLYTCKPGTKPTNPPTIVPKMAKPIRVKSAVIVMPNRPNQTHPARHGLPPTRPRQ